MKYLQVFVMLISICSFVEGDPCAPHRDGCTTYLSLPYSGTFRDSCNKHDMCYSCGHVYGFSRSDCDTRFYDDIWDDCRGGFFCKCWAYIYYKGVRIFGSWFHHGNKYFCNEPWVRPCMKR